MSNLNPIKKGKYFLTFLPTGNNLFNELIMTYIKNIYFNHPNEFFLELSHFDLYILNSRSRLEGLLPFFMNDKEKILSLLNEFANPKKMASFFVNNATPDFLFIRPSGNPINAKEFEQMITGDIVQEKAEITKIHRFEFLSETIVMCIFTLGSKFTYKGTPNDDLPTVTSIFKKVNNVWKIHWMQRSTGNSDLSLWD